MACLSDGAPLLIEEEKRNCAVAVFADVLMQVSVDVVSGFYKRLIYCGLFYGVCCRTGSQCPSLYVGASD